MGECVKGLRGKKEKERTHGGGGREYEGIDGDGEKKERSSEELYQMEDF